MPPNPPRPVPRGAVAPGAVPGQPPRPNPPALAPQPKPIGPPRMTAGQKAARDARAGPKLPAGPNQAIKSGELGKGHTSARHIDITPHQMVDRLRGLDPGKATHDPNKVKGVVTSFASKTQAQQAVGGAMKQAPVQKALAGIAKQPVGAVGKAVTVTLPKPVAINVMRGPQPVKIDGRKVLPQGPPNLTTEQTRKVTIRSEHGPKGPGLHTAFGVPRNPKGA